MSRGGWTGSHVDIMHCVMLKNISREPNGCCRKTDWRDQRGSKNIWDLLCSYFTMMWSLWQKQHHYEDIRLPKWWHMAITDSSLTVSRIYLNNHEQSSSTLDIFFKRGWKFWVALNVTQVNCVNMWACPTPPPSNQCLPLCPIHLCWQQKMLILVVAHNGFLCMMEIVHIFCSDYFGYKGAFEQFLICIAV